MGVPKAWREQNAELVKQGLKCCYKCRIIKPVLEFNHDANRPDGFSSNCRECDDKYMREHYIKKPLHPKKAERQQLLAQGLRRCTSCQEIKPLSEFTRKAHKADGWDGWCRTCNKACHDTYRSDPEKAEHDRQTHREWVARNPLVVKAHSKRNYWKDPERARARTNAWRQEHIEEQKEKSRVRTAAWIKANPDKNHVLSLRRRIRERGSEGVFSYEDWMHLVDLCGGVCACCGEEKPLTRDHVIPLTWGGSNYIANIQPLCKPCNSAKGDRRDTDYRSAAVKYWVLCHALTAVTLAWEDIP